jgi:hypothetical protein
MTEPAETDDATTGTAAPQSAALGFDSRSSAGRARPAALKRTMIRDAQHLPLPRCAHHVAKDQKSERDTGSMRLYHVTSRGVAERIKAEGFHGHEVLYGEHPATDGNWLNDNPKTESTLGLVLMSIDIPDDELANQPTPEQRLAQSQRTNDYYVDAEILNRHLDSIQVEA